MASVKGTFNPSQALITPGYPLAQIAHSNPNAVTQLNEGSTSTPSTSTVLKNTLIQIGHTSDRID